MFREAREVEVHGPSEEQVANVKKRQLHDISHQNFLKEHEESLQGHAQHHQAQEQNERLEALVGQIFIDIRLGHPAALDRLLIVGDLGANFTKADRQPGRIPLEESSQ